MSILLIVDRALAGPLINLTAPARGGVVKTLKGIYCVLIFRGIYCVLSTKTIFRIPARQVPPKLGHLPVKGAAVLRTLAFNLVQSPPIKVLSRSISCKNFSLGRKVVRTDRLNLLTKGR